MQLFDLTGKVAIITGSTKGIGEAIAHRFAEHGARVIISSRKADACERVAGEVNAKWGKGKEVAHPIPCNINLREQLLMSGWLIANSLIDVQVAGSTGEGSMVGYADGPNGFTGDTAAVMQVLDAGGRLSLVEPQIGLPGGRVGAMAIKTFFGQDRPNIRRKIDRRARWLVAPTVAGKAAQQKR